MTSHTNDKDGEAAVSVSDTPQPPPTCFALLGNPNTGKTTLFNRLCGIRAQTSNFPGSTVEARIGAMPHGGRIIELVDLPGIYGLNLAMPESKTCKRYLHGEVTLGQRPQGVVVVADATNLQRNLIFVTQAIQQGLPAVIALNMTDLAERRGLTIDIDGLAGQLGVPVISVCARSGEGIDELLEAMQRPTMSNGQLPSPTDPNEAGEWAERVVAATIHRAEPVHPTGRTATDHTDWFLTHPVMGLISFGVIMTGLFFTIFSLASVPMDLIELTFEQLQAMATRLLPDGAFQDLVANGVVGGVAGTVVFLPQICLLFFLISLLEDTGYLARGAFVMDRFLRKFGLPGQAFVPMLTAHACAIPAIMSSKLIPDRRDRIATVLITPFMSCSARIPVYALLVVVLFPHNTLHQALGFAGCYVLGAVVAIGSALVFRRTLLRGPSRPMVLELPTYKIPSLRTALLTTIDRGWLFLRKAGTVIMAICVILWWLSSYPATEPPASVVTMQAEARAIQMSDPDGASALLEEAGIIEARHAMSESFAGRIGRFAEPAMQPLGCDWQLTIGVMTSFAAREVFASTMSVLLAGTDDAEDEGVRARIATARRDDGTPVFTTATAAAVLVFFVLGMQCLPTLPVTARETGHWKWAGLQLAYMTTIAYVLAMLTYQGVQLYGGA